MPKLLYPIPSLTFSALPDFYNVRVFVHPTVHTPSLWSGGSAPLSGLVAPRSVTLSRLQAREVYAHVRVDAHQDQVQHPHDGRHDKNGHGIESLEAEAETIVGADAERVLVIVEATVARTLR